MVANCATVSIEHTDFFTSRHEEAAAQRIGNVACCHETEFDTDRCEHEDVCPFEGPSGHKKVNAEHNEEEQEC